MIWMDLLVVPKADAKQVENLKEQMDYGACMVLGLVCNMQKFYYINQ